MIQIINFAVIFFLHLKALLNPISNNLDQLIDLYFNHSDLKFICITNLSCYNFRYYFEP